MYQLEWKGINVLLQQRCFVEEREEYKLKRRDGEREKREKGIREDGLEEDEGEEWIVCKKTRAAEHLNKRRTEWREDERENR